MPIDEDPAGHPVNEIANAALDAARERADEDGVTIRSLIVLLEVERDTADGAELELRKTVAATGKRLLEEVTANDGDPGRVGARRAPRAREGRRGGDRPPDRRGAHDADRAGMTAVATTAAVGVLARPQLLARARAIAASAPDWSAAAVGEVDSGVARLAYDVHGLGARDVVGLEYEALALALGAMPPGRSYFDHILRGEHSVAADVTAALARQPLIGRYAWAIPNAAALDAIAAWGPVVDVGAGGGYWAHLLAGRGVDVVAYDQAPGWQTRGFLWAPVERAEATVAGRHPDRTLLLCWPPYDDPMAAEALTAHAAAGGQRVAYIGEGPGGCNADDRFHALLEERYAPLDDVAIPQWPGIHDYLELWQAEDRHGGGPR